MEKESETYELISSLMDNEIQIQEDLDSALDILLSDKKYRDFWYNCHLIKDNLADIDKETQQFFHNESSIFSHIKYKISFLFNKSLKYIKNYFNFLLILASVLATITFVSLGIWSFYSNFNKNYSVNYYALNKDYNTKVANKYITGNKSLGTTSVDYNNSILYKKLLKKINSYVLSKKYVLNFGKYLSDVLYKFEEESEFYLKTEDLQLENDKEIFVDFLIDHL